MLKLTIGHKSTFSKCKKLIILKFFLFDQILTFDQWPRPRFKKKGQIFWNFLNMNFQSKNIIDFENRLPFFSAFFLELINFRLVGAG